MDREAGVVELFAHDREALAWRLATADRGVVDALDTTVRSSHAETWPVRSRLALSAIEVLDGLVPSEPLARTRSPALEMPPALRYLAHRTDIRDEIIRGLGRARHTTVGWGWLIVETTSPLPLAEHPYYIQFTSYPGPGLRAEAVGNAHLPRERHLDQRAELQIKRLGWREGSELATAGNWTLQVRAGTRANRESIAELALVTLEKVFGCGPGTRFRVTTDVWTPQQSKRPSS